MQIHRNVVLRDIILDGFIAQNLPYRKIDEPWHVSDLVSCLRRAYWNRVDPLPPTHRQALLFITGRGMAAQLTGGEPETGITTDGIICHPDYIKLSPPWEIKSTRKKVDADSEAIREMDTWMEQIMAYMKALGVNKFELVELGLMGNYAPPFPALEVWELEATQEEVEANWEEMLLRRATLDQAKQTGTLPPRSQRRNKKGKLWECIECVYPARCQGGEE